MTDKTCVHCEKIFHVRGKSRSITALYCSLKCRKDHTRLQKICEQCGKSFTLQLSHSERRFCSTECGHQFQKEHSGSMRICPVCNETFYKKGNPINGIYCSRLCSALGRKTGKIINCNYCGKEVYKNNATIKKYANLFCSQECANLYKGRNKIKYSCKMCGNEFYWSMSRSNPTYCSMVCRNLDKDRLLENSIKGNYAQVHKNGLNKLELAGKLILDDLNIVYQEQVPMFGKFLVDVLVEDSKLVIQWDGDYWHCHPSQAPFSERQIRRAKLDKSQDAYIKKCGYTVLRIWECDIKTRPDWVKSEIQKLIVCE